MRALTVVVPTYQEAANVDALLGRFAEVSRANPDFDITVAVVDDSSPDGTAEVARAFQVPEESDPGRFKVRVDVRATKEGLGAAYIWAFDKYLGEPNPPDYILQMDADLSHDPAYISDLLDEARRGAEVVVASRYIRGGGTPDWSLRRRVLSVGGNMYARLFLGSRITDYTGGFNLYSAQVLRRVDITTIMATGYGFIIVLKYRVLAVTDRVSQVPIVFTDRTHGESKIPRNTMITTLGLVPRLRFGRSPRTVG